MKLVGVKTLPVDMVQQFLWNMLRDRDPRVNISHKEMPTRKQHDSFVLSHPYKDWWIITQDEQWGGHCYVTDQNEIGIHLLPNFQHQGIGRTAIHRIISQGGSGRYLANIAPTNVASQDFFRSLGFKLIQYTFEFTMEG